MSTVALLVHHERPEAADVAAALYERLLAGGHVVRLPPDDARVVGLPGLAVAEAALADGGLDLAVAIGGDGTILRTV